MQDAVAALRHGADAVGFIFAESPRKVDKRLVKKICSEVGPWMTTIGVFVNESPRVVRAIAAECGLGSGDLGPVFTPVDIAPVQLQDVVIDALAGVPGIDNLLEPAWPIPRAYPLHPYALTNPIWIDRDGDGFDPPGIATWLAAPEE